MAVLVNGRKIKFQGGDPTLENGRVQVPLRGIGEALEARIGFSGKTVTYEKNGKSIILTLGSKTATVDGKSVTLDTAAKAIEGRTYVPLRFVSENLGEKVTWDQVGNWVWIGSQEIPDITEVTELEDIASFEDYFKGKDFFLEPYGEKISKARVVSYENMPVTIGKITFMDMWMVTDGENYGIRVRFKGPKRIVMDYLSGVGDVRSRTGHVVEQPDGTNIAQFIIRTAGDKAIYNDKNWKNYSIKSIDYFFLAGTYKDDSIHIISNPFK
ncbi:hypothetical protein D3C76_1030000 [compost metagenome]